MLLFAELSPIVFLLPAAMAAISACVAVWVLVWVRWSQRQPVVPYQPRRPVPWGGLDLLLVVVFYLAAQSGAAELAGVVSGPSTIRPSVGYNPERSNAAHPLARLVAEGNPWVLLLCFVSAVIAAPLFEEFLFRVLLQGWLEALERRWRRQMPTLRRLVPRAFGPIMLASLLFAAMHFRVAGPPINTHSTVFLLAGSATVSLLTMIFAICLVRWRVRATAADLGWAPRKLLRDIGLGLGGLAAVIAPVYAMQITLGSWLPDYLAPDPIPLFFLALVLGTLYFRTHRMAPSMAVHAALNATSLALAWWGAA
jgi:membrane protease YdiL (CAAX protease family)